MATFPCENKSLCVDPATPFQNFSAEAPDGHISIARSTGFGPSYPPLGSDFFAVGCTVFCESTVSQEDADLCAARNWVECVSIVWPEWRPVTDVFGNRVFAPFPRPVFLNAAQTATVFCPDGNPFSFTVPAGRYAAFNQSQADDAAFSAALDKAEQFKLCVTDLSHPQVCADSAYADSVTAIGNFLNTDTTCWTIFGTLPPGIDTDLDLSFQGCLTGDNTFHFFGSPTVPGDYSFSIQVTDDVGSFMVKQLTIRVMGITTDSLPNGVPFNAYSEFLDAAGVTNPIFAIESGTLPAGMAFDTASGQIFGTPIAASMTAFVFSVTEAGTGITCEKELSLTIVAACSPLPTSQFTVNIGGTSPTGLAFRSNYGANTPLLLACDSLGAGTLTSISLLPGHATSSIVPGDFFRHLAYSPPNDKFIGVGIATGAINRITPEPLAIFSNTVFGGVSEQGGIVCHSVTGLAYFTSNQNLRVYDPATNTLVGLIVDAGDPLQQFFGLSIDESTNRLFVCRNDLNVFSVGTIEVYDISLPAPAFIASYAVPANAFSRAGSCVFCPTQNRLYVVGRKLTPTFNYYASMDAATGVFSNVTANGFFTANSLSLPGYNPATDLIFIPQDALYTVICPLTDAAIGTCVPAAGGNVTQCCFESVGNSLCEVANLSRIVDSFA